MVTDMATNRAPNAQEHVVLFRLHERRRCDAVPARDRIRKGHSLAVKLIKFVTSAPPVGSYTQWDRPDEFMSHAIRE